MSTRSKAVALSISLVIAASGAGGGSAVAQPSSAADDTAPALQDDGSGMGDAGDAGGVSETPPAAHS